MGLEEEKHAPDRQIIPMSLPLRSIVIVRIGLAIWMIALTLVWAVPSLSDGDRSWWRWVPIAGLTIGALGYAYVRRARGRETSF